VFPKNSSEPITSGPLELVWCPDSGLLQLHHSYEAGEMYGGNYGYRSGLNQSMVNHLTEKVRYLERLLSLNPHDVVLDIGSNDATTLRAYQTKDIRRIGIDPTGNKFRQYYPKEIRLVPIFFPKPRIARLRKTRPRLSLQLPCFMTSTSPSNLLNKSRQS